MKAASIEGTAPGVQRPALLNRLRSILLAATAMLAVLIILLSTRWGAALGDDSYWYIKPARDALAGLKLETNALFPPFLPIVLTGLGLLGLEPVEAIRYLNSILFGITVLLTFFIVLELSGSFTFSFLATISILLSSGLIEVFASALSEAMYVSLTLASIYAAGRYFKDGRTPWLAASAFSAGLSAFTRYAGIAAIASIAILVLLKNKRRWNSRLKETLGFLGISMAPIAAYAIRNLLILGRPVGQSQFSWLLVRQFPLRLLLNNVLDWFVPGRLVAGYEYELTLLILLTMIGVSIVFWLIYRRKLALPAKTVLTSATFLILAAFIAFNLIILSLSRGFFSGGNPFNPRYLSPIQLSAFMLFFGLLGALYAATRRISRSLIIVTSIAMLALLGIRAAHTIQVLYHQGSGYSSQRWHISETIAYLNRRPNTPVMSTAAPGVYFWTGRRPIDLPTSNPRESVREFLCESEGFLVIIDSLPTEFYGIDHEEITSGLIVEQDFSEGTIYRIDASECG